MPTATMPDPGYVEIPKPGLPSPADIGKTQYILYYRQGNNPHPQFLFFYFLSRDMKLVSARAKSHCDAMSYRFVYVKEAVVDLDKAERQLLERDA